MLPATFLDFDLEQEWNPSPLHKLILNGRPCLQLNDIEHYCSEIDHVDELGRSALWWAAARGDWESARTLLNCGADPNLADSEKWTPLHMALRTRSPNLETIDLMLRCGADVLRVDAEGRNVLHCAAEFGHGRDIFERVAASGVDLNQRDVYGKTPLSRASYYDSDVIVRCLLERGADAEIADRDIGYTPLLTSIGRNLHNSLRHLLSHGVNMQVVGWRGITVLGFASSKGDVTTMDILAAHGVGGQLDPLVKDRDGNMIFDFHIPQYIHSSARLNTMLRVLASGRCGPCTADAEAGRPAVAGGCPHGMLTELGLQELIDSMDLHLHEDDTDDEYDGQSESEKSDWEENTDEEYVSDDEVRSNDYKDLEPAQEAGVPVDDEHDEFFDTLEEI